MSELDILRERLKNSEKRNEDLQATFKNYRLLIKTLKYTCTILFESVIRINNERKMQENEQLRTTYVETLELSSKNFKLLVSTVNSLLVENRKLKDNIATLKMRKSESKKTRK